MAARGRNPSGGKPRPARGRPGGPRGSKASPRGATRSAGASTRSRARAEGTRRAPAPARTGGDDPRFRADPRPGSGGRAAGSDAPHPDGERLQKVLGRLGVASRREAEEWIRAGRLTVNGAVAALGRRVGRSDHLRLDGRLIHRHEIAAGQVYVCHRSPGENLRTPEESSEHIALLERLPRRAGNRFITVSPMPHIDGGLEIVTSDGELAAKLQRAVHGLAAEYSVRVRGELAEPQLGAVLEGLLDRGERLQVESCEPGGGEAANRWYTVVARGGSGKDVRQLFERQGALVSRVLRTRLGALELDRRLSRGQFRPLTREEISALLAPPEDSTEDEGESSLPDSLRR